VLVFLFYVAFVGAPFLVGAVNWLLQPFDTTITIRQFDFVWRAIVALTICYSAFIAEIFRAGIESVDRGQLEAARSLGLSRWKCFRLVTFPQALRTILPPLANDFVSMIKDSALVSALGVQDITQLGKVYSSGTFLFFETYNVVAFLYLTMTISLSLLVRLLERYLRENAR
jgi:polar amino acid transport system permease protein